MRTDWKNEKPSYDHEDDMRQDRAGVFLICEIAHWRVSFCSRYRSSRRGGRGVHLHRTMPMVVAVRDCVYNMGEEE